MSSLYRRLASKFTSKEVESHSEEEESTLSSQYEKEVEDVRHAAVIDDDLDSAVVTGERFESFSTPSAELELESLLERIKGEYDRSHDISVVEQVLPGANCSSSIEAERNIDFVARFIKMTSVGQEDRKLLTTTLMKSINAVASRAQDAVQVRKQMGEMLAAHGFKDEARSVFASIIDDIADVKFDEQYLKLYAKDAPAYQRAEAMRQMYTRHSDDYRWLYDYGKVLHQAQQYNEAAKSFEESYRVNKGGPWRIYRAGLAYELAGDFKNARAAYRKAIHDDKKLDAKKWGLGALHEEMSRFEPHWDMAGHSYEESALEASSSGMQALLFARAGRAFQRALDCDNSVRLLEKAIALRPEQVEWYEDLAVSYELRGDYEDGAQHLLFVLASVPVSSEQEKRITRNAGWLLYRAGQYETAAYYLLQSVGAFPVSQDVPADEQSEGAGIFALQPKGLMQRHIPTFESMTDRIGHMQRARVYTSLQCDDLAYREWRMALMFGAPSALEVALPAARMFYNSGSWELACRAILSLQLFNAAIPRGVSTPKERSYAERLAAYAEWRDTLPVERDVILWESNFGSSADCNPLYLFRQVISDHPGEFIHVWAMKVGAPIPVEILECADVLIVPINGRLYTRFLATAGYLVNNSTFPAWFVRRKEQRYLMTWHGTPLKAMAKRMNGVPVHFNMTRNYLQATYAIFPNEHTRDALIDGCDVHGLTTANIDVTGYPRNDSLVHIRGVESSRERKRVLYAPTHRDDIDIDQQIHELLRVKEIVEEQGYDLLIRMHHYVEEEALKHDETLVFVSRSVPTYDLLPETDILITDFSSIFFDYALTERPILHLIHDWDQYASSRALYFDKDVLPGMVCESWEQFSRAISNPTVDIERYRSFNSRFSPKDDGRASERVMAAFLASEDKDYPEPEPREFLFRQSLLPNGMSQSFVNLANELDARGHDVTVLTEGDSIKTDVKRWQVAQKLPQNIRLIGRTGQAPRSRVELHAATLSQHILQPVRTLDRINEHFFEREAQRTLPCRFRFVIEFDGYSPFYSRLMQTIGADATTACYLHSDIDEEIQSRLPMLKEQVRLMPGFDRIIAVTRELMDVNEQKLAATYGVDLSNITFARNLVLNRLVGEKKQGPLPETFARFAEGASPLLVQVGRLSVEKNHLFTLQALKRAIDNGASSRLAIIGDGPLRSELEGKATELGIHDSVLFVGHTNNPYPMMASADGLVLTSFYEGQPLVILEARILGLPVLASDIAAARRLADYFSSSVEVIPFDVNLWAEAIQRIEALPHDRWNSEDYCDEALDEFYEALGVESV